MKKIDYAVGFSETEILRLRAHFGDKKPKGLEFFELDDGSLLVKAPGFENLWVPKGEWGDTSAVVIDVVIVVQI